MILIVIGDVFHINRINDYTQKYKEKDELDKITIVEIIDEDSSNLSSYSDDEIVVDLDENQLQKNELSDEVLLFF